MAVVIPVSDEEKIKTLNAIKELNAIPHLKYMSQAMIAKSAKLKATKVRAVLVELIEEERIVQYVLTKNAHLQRYYYVVNDEAYEGLEEEVPQSADSLSV